MSCDVGEAFRHFIYVTAHSPTLPSLYLRHNSFANPPVASPTSQLILQAFRHFTYVTAHSPSFPSLHLRHSSFSNPSVALPTSQLILQPFRCFTYVTAHSPTLLSLLLRHRLFTQVTWRVAHGFLSTVRQMSGNLGHILPRLSYIIRLRTATVSDFSCSTWSSLNNKQHLSYGVHIVKRQSEFFVQLIHLTNMLQIKQS